MFSAASGVSTSTADRRSFHRSMTACRAASTAPCYVIGRNKRACRFLVRPFAEQECHLDRFTRRDGHPSSARRRMGRARRPTRPGRCDELHRERIGQRAVTADEARTIACHRSALRDDVQECHMRLPNAARNVLRAKRAPQTVSIDVTMCAAERERVSDRHQST